MTVTQGSDAYASMIKHYVALGYSPYILTLMFKQLRGTPAAIEAQMDWIAEHLFTAHLLRIVRRPNSRYSWGALPIWLLPTDLPVYKREKQSLSSVMVNGGLHKQGVALHPPYTRDGKTLEEHFASMHDFYKGRFPDIQEIHVKSITHDVAYVSDYIFKTVARGRVEADSVLIMPRSRSEL